MVKTVISSKLAKEGQKNSNVQNGFYEDEVSFYIEKMKDEFEKEMIHFRDIKKCPTCLFALIFETQHPCYELYFNLIELISRLETSKKTVSLNLHDLLSSSFLSEKSVTLFQMNGNKIGESKDDEDDDDFIIVDKVNNIKMNGTIDCVISLKESKEIQNKSTTDNNNDKSDKIYLSQFGDKKNDLPFVLEFMKTQMFVSFREQSCKQKTDEEAEIIEK